MQTKQVNQDITLEETIPVPVAKTAEHTIYYSIWKKWQRFIGFGFVGGGVAIGGTLLLYILVHFLHLNQSLAYAIQSVASIETNFILNRSLNWRDRSGKFASQWAKFHVSKIGTQGVRQAMASAHLD